MSLISIIVNNVFSSSLTILLISFNEFCHCFNTNLTFSQFLVLSSPANINLLTLLK